jgi:hypothetical protein
MVVTRVDRSGESLLLRAVVFVGAVLATWVALVLFAGRASAEEKPTTHGAQASDSQANQVGTVAEPAPPPPVEPAPLGDQTSQTSNDVPAQDSLSTGLPRQTHTDLVQDEPAPASQPAPAHSQSAQADLPAQATHVADSLPTHVNQPAHVSRPGHSGLFGLLGVVLDLAKPLVGNVVGLVHGVASPVAEVTGMTVYPPHALGVAEVRNQTEVVTAPVVVSIRPVPAAPVVVQTVAPAAPRLVPVTRAVAPQTPARVPHPVAPRTRPVPPPPVLVMVTGSSDEQADNHESRDRPAAPAAPAAPGSTASSSASDGGGHARGLTGMLAGRDPFTPPTAAALAGTRDIDAHGRCAGLPASSPD